MSKQTTINGILYDRILMEDDCAPDAYAYFSKDLELVTGMGVEDFKEQARRVDLADEITMEWHYQDFVLAYHGDDPWYKLYRKASTL